MVCTPAVRNPRSQPVDFAMNSCLYEAKVFHRRLWPRTHEFLYRVFYFCLDLDELPVLAKYSPRLLGIERAGIFSFRSIDHWGKKETVDLRSRVEGFLTARNLPKPQKILLLTNLRMFGYVFNPIAVYFCLDGSGQPIAAITQVGNTFGEQKLYLVPCDPSTPEFFHTRLPKEFYVSPFSDLDFEFDFRLHTPGKSLRVFIDEYRQEERILISTLTGTRRELTSQRLLSYIFTYPLLTLRIIFLIHWQALRLWAKKLPFHRKEAMPHLQKKILNPLPGHSIEK
jgi:DUF1365 family protein